MAKKRSGRLKLNLPKARVIEAPASLGKRFIAFFLDIMVIQIVLFAPFRQLIETIIPKGLDYTELIIYLENNPATQETMALVLAIFGTIIVMYFSLLEYYTEQSIGKLLFGIYIKAEKKLTFFQIVVSNLTFLPFFPFMILWVIDPVHILFSAKKQRFMEKIMKITVVQRYLV